MSATRGARPDAAAAAVRGRSRTGRAAARLVAVSCRRYTAPGVAAPDEAWRRAAASVPTARSGLPGGLVEAAVQLVPGPGCARRRGVWPAGQPRRT